MGARTEWAYAPRALFWTIGREEEAPDHQTLAGDGAPDGTIGLIFDGGGGGAYCMYGQPAEVIAALERAIETVRRAP